MTEIDWHFDDEQLDDERETCMACDRPTYRDEAKRVDGGYLCPDCGDRWLFPVGPEASA